MTTEAALPPAALPLDRIAAEAVATRAAGLRIRRIEVEGRGYWVKTQERLTMRMRLQKGDPHRAFLAEREAVRGLSEAGLPVPPVVASGEGWFVTPDSGPSLAALLADRGMAPEARVPAFRAAGQGLAGFHARGLSHGRPSIRDICWDGARAIFLDLERYAPKRNTHSGHVQDLVILVFSAFAATGRPCPETEALARGYRSADPAGIWEGAVRLCRRLRWVDPLSRPIRRLKRGRAPEFDAIPLTLAAFAP